MARALDAFGPLNFVKLGGVDLLFFTETCNSRFLKLSGNPAIDFIFVSFIKGAYG